MADIAFKTIFIAWTNTDCTEGRGRRYPIAYSECEATIRRIGKGQSVQGGTDITVENAYQLEPGGAWMAPVYLTPSTKEDDALQKKIDQKKNAIEKARDLGMSEDDIKSLGLKTNA